MILSESEIKALAKESVEEAVNKYAIQDEGLNKERIMDGITLYHRPKDGYTMVDGKRMTIAESVLKYGFSREFTNSNGGNMYGAGVYTVYSLRSSNENATGYGSNIIKMKLVGGYKDFIIFSVQLAKETYGRNWRVEDQIKMMFPDDANNILNAMGHITMHNETGGQSKEMSSHSCYAMTNYFRRYPEILKKSKVRGYVYNGGHDGACCLVLDFASVIPVAISKDNGKTWKYTLTDELIERYNNEVDTDFQYGGQYKSVATKAVNGFTSVWNNDNKINYIQAGSSEPISNIWFDEGTNWMTLPTGEKYVNVKYKKYSLYIIYENNEYNVYAKDWEPICSLNELSKEA